MEVRARRTAWADSVELMVIVRDRIGAAVAKPIEFERMPEGSMYTQPTMTIHNHEAQILMDELWNCGLRPSEGSGSAGSLAATERHLADMKKIAMGLLQKHGVT